ncbi:unnamed protein product, partial [Iphiclides podalirius]
MANEPEPTDLDWVQLRRDMGNMHHVETNKEKFIRKFSENPFVPIGCLATAGALTYGLWCFRNGKSKLSQKMMRLRIVAQGSRLAMAEGLSSRGLVAHGAGGTQTELACGVWQWGENSVGIKIRSSPYPLQPKIGE